VNSSTLGQAVTFSAWLMALNGTPTGSVTFMDGDVVLGVAEIVPVGLGTYRADFTTTGLTAGLHTIRAVYSGDENFAGATSLPYSQTVTG